MRGVLLWVLWGLGLLAIAYFALARRKFTRKGP